MGNWIELPQTPQGTAEEQMRQMYSYLYRVAETLNHNLSEIGSMDLTDEEREVMQAITAEEEGQKAAAYDWQGKESLKSLIIKTAAFVQNKLDAYRLNLLGEYVTEGKFGKYVRNTSLKVDVTPTGIQQDFTFEEVVQGLKNYTINAKNYIKTGLLRTVGGVPVYGVAIGKDVVTFSEDGTETYNDGNKVAELTADELSFYQNGNKIASYAGSKIYCYGDFEISVGNKLIINTGTNAKWTYDAAGMTYNNTADPLPFQVARYDEREYLTNGVFYDFSNSEQTGEVILLAECRNGEHTSASGFWRGEVAYAMTDNTGDLDTDGSIGVFYPRAGRGTLGTRSKPWTYLFCRNLLGETENGMGVIVLNPTPTLAKRQMGLNVQHTEYTENSVTKDQIYLIPSSSLNKFVIQGNASESNSLIGFNVISGVKNINGKTGETSITIRPNSASGKQNVRLIFYETVINNQQYLIIYKDTGVDKLQFQGDITGNASTATSATTATTAGSATKAGYVDCPANASITDMNNLTEPGRCWMNMSTATHKPSELTAGSVVVDVIVYSTIIIQIIYGEGIIYTRHKRSDTWGSWYKYAGTVVA